MTLFLLGAAIACLHGTGRPCAWARTPEAPGRARRALTFPERVGYQYAIEEVYWRHRIWPKENPGPKPSLDAIVSQGQIEQKVEDYLRKSQWVTDQRGWPITASELQTEIDRMARDTKRPGVLRELFQALGNHPYLIAECLARPVLAQRLSADLAVVAGVPPAPRRLSTAGTAASTDNRLGAQTNRDNAAYRLPEISTDCTDDAWTATTTVNAPDARELHTVVWTGSEMIIWGGFTFSPPYRLNTGGRYDPSTDSWVPTGLNNAPSPRDNHSAVWTGTEMIVWGGEPILNTGGRYNPITDTWTATSTTNAPTARAAHTAVWTDSEMVVWGGRNESVWFNTGGRYDPNTDSWTATSTTNAPEARWAHTVEWTGSEMIIWGGTNETIYLNTGGKYNPTDNSWTPIGTANAPLGRVAHAAVWSGSEMIVWGGVDSTFNDSNTGGTYNPAADSWVATTTVNAPSPRAEHTAVWVDNEMIVWGGEFCCPGIDFNTGGRYSPGADTWTATSITNAPTARQLHTAVWTGSEMIVWGGVCCNPPIVWNTGGRYCAQSGATPTPTPTPTATATPTATPTATATATTTATATATATSTPTAAATPTATLSPSPTPTPTPTPTSTPRVTPTPRAQSTPRPRPTPAPRP